MGYTSTKRLIALVMLIALLAAMALAVVVVVVVIVAACVSKIGIEITEIEVEGETAKIALLC